MLEFRTCAIQFTLFTQIRVDGDDGTGGTVSPVAIARKYINIMKRSTMYTRQFERLLNNNYTIFIIIIFIYYLLDTVPDKSFNNVI